MIQPRILLAVLAAGIACYVYTYLSPSETLNTQYRKDWHTDGLRYDDAGSSLPPSGSVHFALHQTYKTCDEDRLPEYWRATPGAWRDEFPEAHYRCWDDEALRSLVSAHAPSFLATYDAYPYFIQRVDAARYFILYVYGGLYADMDMMPTAELAGVIRDALRRSPDGASWSCSEGGSAFPSVVLFESKMASRLLPPSTRITNAIMLAPEPQSTFFRHVIDGLVPAFERTPSLHYLGNYYNVLSTTGSRFLNLRFLDYRHSHPLQDAREEVCVVPTVLTRRAIISLQGSSWHEGATSSFIRTFIQPLLIWAA